MHIEGSVIPDGPIDEYEDAWEEFDEFANQMLNLDQRAYIGFQVTGDDFERFINFVPLSEDEWGVTVGDSERTLSTAALQELLHALFGDEIPDWVRDAPDIDKTVTGLSRW